MSDKTSARHVIDWRNPDYLDPEKLDL